MPEPKTLAFVLIENNRRYLIVQEKRNPKLRGLYGLPGGKVDTGESPYQAAVRETSEEVGLKVVPGDILIDVTETSRRYIIYRGQTADYNFKINRTDLMAADWLTLDEVKTLKVNQKLRGDWVLDAIIKAA